MFYLYLTSMFALKAPRKQYKNCLQSIHISAASSNFNYSTVDPYGNLITIRKHANSKNNETVVTFTHSIGSRQIASDINLVTTLTRQSEGKYLREVTKGILSQGSCNLESKMLGKTESNEIDEIVEEVQKLSNANISKLDFEDDPFENPLMVQPFDFEDNIAKTMEKELLIQDVLSKLYKYVD